MGADVENPQGQDLGDIKDVVIDRASGRIAYAVVSFGGFLGMGEKLFAVPWGAFSQPSDNKDKFVLAVDKERLTNAPGFDANNWPQMASQEWVTSLYSYYNVPPIGQPLRMHPWLRRQSRMWTRTRGLSRCKWMDGCCKTSRLVIVLR